VKSLQCEAAKLDAEDLLRCTGKSDQIRGQAILLEMELSKETADGAIAACQEEIKFLEETLDQLKPHCKYDNYQDAQREEWKLEFIQRAKLFICSHGTIPHDQLKSMASHPDFKEAIVPVLKELGWITDIEKLASLGDSSYPLKLLGNK
jgi:hypothetical protein